jgi:hypothetical protein
MKRIEEKGSIQSYYNVESLNHGGTGETGLKKQLLRP